MAEPVLRVERGEGVALVTLNRPRSLNALSAELRRALSDAFAALQADDRIAVAILTGAGRAFSAGVDLKELGSGAAQEARREPWGNPTAAIAAFRGPVIGAINGPAVTGGFELALACDVLVGSTAATFADTHARVGLSPGWGLSQKLPRIIGLARAKELSLTGNFIDAPTAERWGLVNRVVEPDDLLPACRRMAADMLGAVPGFLAHYKRLLDTGYGMTFRDAMAYEAEIARAYNDVVAADAIEARREAVRRRGRRQAGMSPEEDA